MLKLDRNSRSASQIKKSRGGKVLDVDGEFKKAPPTKLSIEAGPSSQYFGFDEMVDQWRDNQMKVNKDLGSHMKAQSKVLQQLKASKAAMGPETADELGTVKENMLPSQVVKKDSETAATVKKGSVPETGFYVSDSIKKS